MSKRPHNTIVDLGDLGAKLREIGCPECDMAYKSMKVDKDGTAVARFQGEGNIRAIEIEADEEVLRALSTQAPYRAHSVIREVQSHIDVDVFGGSDPLPGMEA